MLLARSSMRSTQHLSLKALAKPMYHRSLELYDTACHCHTAKLPPAPALATAAGNALARPPLPLPHAALYVSHTFNMGGTCQAPQAQLVRDAACLQTWALAPTPEFEESMTHTVCRSAHFYQVVSTFISEQCLHPAPTHTKYQVDSQPMCYQCDVCLWHERTQHSHQQCIKRGTAASTSSPVGKGCC